MRLAQIFVVLPDAELDGNGCPPSNEEGWFADYMSEWLRNAEHDGIIVDWGYVNDKNEPDEFRTPKEMELKQADYDEGDLYNDPLAQGWNGPR